MDHLWTNAAECPPDFNSIAEEMDTAGWTVTVLPYRPSVVRAHLVATRPDTTTLLIRAKRRTNSTGSTSWSKRSRHHYLKLANGSWYKLGGIDMFRDVVHNPGLVPAGTRMSHDPIGWDRCVSLACQCGKKSYQTSDEAERAKFELMIKKGSSRGGRGYLGDVYPCPSGSGNWHITKRQRSSSRR